MANIVGKTTLHFGGQKIEVVAMSPPSCGNVALGSVVPYAEFTIEIDSVKYERCCFATEAGYLIHQMPPIRFPRNRAGQLGNKCAELLRRAERA
jgi:hypothetical protein